ncbi:hypothetical protein Rhow_000168 [Rhodococcus wratislaviensis]|uniref:Uncharacterized protein n=1 Tax=Rhodococcus wratislaviensis TaxID=44752 RepID=A0A402C202_RHOWR|nr:hypothetical protein Rhow_000168 [Rhodococcus wratislaviensis]
MNGRGKVHSLMLPHTLSRCAGGCVEDRRARTVRPAPC